MMRVLFIWIRGILVSLAALAVIATASAYLLLNYDRLTQTASSAASPAAGSGVDRDSEIVTLRDFQSFQRQTSEMLQSSNQDIAAQQADLRKLSDQISALATRIDAMQSTASIAQAQQVGPARSPDLAARKKPAAAKGKGGGISVGGAPLPAARPDDQ